MASEFAWRVSKYCGCVVEQNNKILIVDDEVRNLKILRIRLEDHYQLVEAGSGEEALEKLKTFKPALILLDIMMDGIDGYEVTRAVKADPALEGVKVILVSGKAMIDEKLVGYDAGADDYITKPFNGEELMAKVNVFVRLHNLEASLLSMNRSLEEEIKKRYHELIQAERLASVGMNSAELVHNLKNPLAIAMGNISLLKRKAAYDEPRIDAVEKALNRVLDIVQGILVATPKDLKSEFTEVAIEEVLREELEFLNIKAEFKYKISKQENLSHSRQVWASKVQVSQILGNLIKNAAEAMLTKEADAMITINSRDDGDFVVVDVGDNGPGIAADKLEKIFDPTFTTKNGVDGGPIGNGLGLSYCKKSIESIGGKIEVRSQEGVGTTFSLRFPVAAAGQAGDKDQVV